MHSLNPYPGSAGPVVNPRPGPPVYRPPSYYPRPMPMPNSNPNPNPPSHPPSSVPPIHAHPTGEKAELVAQLRTKSTSNNINL